MFAVDSGFTNAFFCTVAFCFLTRRHLNGVFSAHRYSIALEVRGGAIDSQVASADGLTGWVILLAGRHFHLVWSTGGGCKTLFDVFLFFIRFTTEGKQGTGQGKKR